MDARDASRGIVLLLFALASAIAVEAVEASNPSVAIADGRLSVAAQDVPLSSLLDAIGGLSGIRIELDAAARLQCRAELTTVTFTSVPIEHALRRLLRGKDVVVRSGRDVVAVRVYASRGDHRPPDARGAPGGRHIAGGMDVEDLSRVKRLHADAIGHPDPQKRSSALGRLAATADPSVVMETIVEVLERESNAQVLERALDIARDQEALPVEPLLNFAMSAGLESVRIKAIKRLSEYAGADGRVRRALRVLTTDPAPGVRQTAQQLLDGRPTN
jgi:hypothetical protein